LSNIGVVEYLHCLFCSPSASPSDPKRQKVIGAEFTGDDVPAGGAVETAGHINGGVVTVVVLGTSTGHPAPWLV
jgi:hypothetical protein